MIPSKSLGARVLLVFAIFLLIAAPVASLALVAIAGVVKFVHWANYTVLRDERTRQDQTKRDREFILACKSLG